MRPELRRPACPGSAPASRDALQHALNTHLPSTRPPLVEVSELIPECSLVTIPVGHNIHAVRPVEFADVVERWLGDAS